MLHINSVSTVFFRLLFRFFFCLCNQIIVVAFGLSQIYIKIFTIRFICAAIFSFLLYWFLIHVNIPLNVFRKEEAILARTRNKKKMFFVVVLAVWCKNHMLVHWHTCDFCVMVQRPVQFHRIFILRMNCWKWCDYRS